MKRLLLLAMACVATAALAATPALAGSGGSTDPIEVTADVYFEEGDCNSRPTIDVESEEGVIYTLNGEELPLTEFSVDYGASGTVIATAEAGYVIVGQSEFPFAFTFNPETCGGGTTGGTTSGGTTGGGTTGGGTTGGGVSGGGTMGGTTGGVAGAETGGELPFTGLPVWLPLLLAGGLIGAGAFILRRKAGADS